MLTEQEIDWPDDPGPDASIEELADPAHPGELLADGLAAKGWTQAQAAERLGVSRQTMNSVIGGRCRVTANLAVALEAAGFGGARQWVEMQAHWELAQARQRANAKTAA